MYVYRVEDTKGYGPYTTSEVNLTKQLGYHNNPRTHPTPDHDRVRCRAKMYRKFEGVSYASRRHGFVSLDSLKAWFNDKDRKILNEFGFKIVKYRVNLQYVLLFKQQLQFIDVYAQPIETMEIM